MTPLNGNVYCRWLKLHARKNRRLAAALTAGSNIYTASLDIAFRMKTDVCLVTLTFDLLTPK